MKMPAIGKKRCFTHVDGTPGFTAHGNVRLLCSNDTCGEFGRAELWCMDCCSESSPTPRSGVTPLGTEAQQSPNSAALTTLQIIFISIGVIVAVLIILYIIYRILKKYLAKKTEEGGTVNGQRAGLTSSSENGGENEVKYSTQIEDQSDMGALLVNGVEFVRRRSASSEKAGS